LGKLLHFVSLVDILPIFYTKKRYRGRLSKNGSVMKRRREYEEN
jgi:hypothetical protein